MSKEALQKYASLSQANKKKCFALGGWCNRQGNIFTMQEVFDCLYDAAGGNINKLTELIEQLTTKSKVFGRSSVVFGSNDKQMSIIRGADGQLKVVGYNPSFRPPERGQHAAREQQVLRKDGQVRKNVINSQEKLYNLGQSVREIYQGQSNEFITVAMAAIKGFAKAHKISEMIVVERLKKGVYTLNTEGGLKNARIVPKMKTIKLNESQLKELSDATKLTEYKFYNNVQRFLSDLLRDPVGAKVPFLLQANNIARNQLLYHLKSNGIINRHQKISDRDSQGNPKTAKMIIRYSVPKKDFAKKMKKLFIALVAKNVPEKTEKIITENSYQHSLFKDQLDLMKGSPLTMGVIGHPEYKQIDEYAEFINNGLKKDIDECDSGGAMGATAGNDSMGQFSQPLFGVQRRKMPVEIDETTTASNVTPNGDTSMGVAVPFGGDKETLDRTPGFSVERQDESIDELEVLHGSRNKFDRFNHKDNLGKGAGSQCFGWGSYFTDDDSVAQGYVDSFRGDQSNVFQDGMLHLFSYAEKELDEVDNETLDYMYTGSAKCFKNGYTKKKMLFNIYNIVEYLKRCLGYVTSGKIQDLYLFAKQYLIYLVDFNELIANSYLGDIDKFDIQKDGNRYCIRRGNEFVPMERITDDERSMLIEYMNALISSYERVYKWVFDKLQNTELFEPRKSYKYNVTIPDDNGDNYLYWYEPLNRSQFEAIYEALVQAYQNNELNQNMGKFLPMDMLEDGNKEFFYTAMTRREFKETYRMLSTFFGSQEGASTFLMNKLGYDGIKYPAGTRWSKPDGSSDEAYNYVLFDADKSEINNVEEFEPLLEYLDKRMSKVRNDFKTKNYDESSGFSWSDDAEDGKEIVHNEWMIHFSNDAPKISHEGFTQGNDYNGKLKSTTYRRGKTEGGYNYAYLASDVIGQKDWRFLNYLKDRQTPFVMFKGNGYRFYHDQDGEEQVVLNNVQSGTKVLIMSLYDQWCVLSTADPNWKKRKKDINPKPEDERFAMNNTRNILDGVIYSDDDMDKVIKWVMTNFDQYRNKFKY